MERIYLDYQNGTPEAANPSSLHREGRYSARFLEEARQRVAGLINCSASEILFTSGGTEANAAALAGLAKAASSRGKHLVVSAVEHLSILQQAGRLEKEGFSVTVVPVDRTGTIDPEQVERALTAETVLVSVQWANAEVGTIQPIGEIARRVKGRKILFHTDAVAAVGQIDVDLKKVPADALSLAADAFGGPSGAGALFLRRGVRFLPLLVGGAQEEGRRAGTENLTGIIGVGEAAERARSVGEARGARLIPLRDRLIRGILDQIPEASLNGHLSQRLPGHVSFSFPGCDAESLVLALDLEGVSVGLGSACSHQAMKGSHVLRAMGGEESPALGTVVCSLGGSTTEAEIDRALEIVPRVVRARSFTLRQAQGERY